MSLVANTLTAFLLKKVASVRTRSSSSYLFELGDGAVLAK